MIAPRRSGPSPGAAKGQAASPRVLGHRPRGAGAYWKTPETSVVRRAARNMWRPKRERIARLRQSFQPRRHVHFFPVYVIVLHNHVAEVDTDTERDAAILVDPFVAFGYPRFRLSNRGNFKSFKSGMFRQQIFGLAAKAGIP